MVFSNNAAYMQTPEFKEAQRQGHLRYYALHPMTEETKAKIKQSNKGKVKSPEWCLHISESKKGKPSNEKGKPKPSSSYKRSKETRRKMSEGRKRMLAEHPEVVENLRLKLSAEGGRVVLQATKDKISKARCRYFINHPEASKEHSERMKAMWTKKSYVEAVIRAINLRPNKQEIALGKIIDDVCPCQFKYNGDYSLGVILNRYIPDFVNINGKKQVIEFFGSYWHRIDGRGEQETIDKYRQLGWHCLVVWDTELANVRTLKGKIRAFAGGRMS